MTAARNKVKRLHALARRSGPSGDNPTVNYPWYACQVSGIGGQKDKPSDQSD
jgi:hypothetical protein